MLSFDWQQTSAKTALGLDKADGEELRTLGRNDNPFEFENVPVKIEIQIYTRACVRACVCVAVTEEDIKI